MVRAALAALLWLAASPALAQPADEVPLADLLTILEVDGALLAIDARSGGQLELDLRLGERVYWKAAQGRVGMALTDQRILAVAVSSGSWQELRRLQGEEIAGHALLGDRVALLVTSRRAIGYDGGSRNLVESSLGLRERVIDARAGRNVAVIVTDRRALGLSPAVGGFFTTPVSLGEHVERIDVESNVATLTLNRRLLIFRAPTGSWESRLRDLR
jgi:hypothetical protein